MTTPTCVKRGSVGMRLAAGEVVTTTTGRSTSPFPKIDLESNRKATNTLQRVQQWLIANAISEASARDDGFNRRGFEAALKSPSPADLDCAELYLFDAEFLRPVQPRLLKPLGAQADAL
ncbi:hypothetical protein [Bosea massiliensis]|uniref:Uncharacterized protein n=1 Tax=Bosea massiliensis TaxID=151419 RepID=A0ABW0P158_9HYPH